MKKIIISLLCLSALPLISFENPFSMEKDEDVIQNQSTAEKSTYKFENPLTFNKDQFALSSLTFFDIYAKLGFITSMAAGLYAKSKLPETCFKDAARLHTNFLMRPGGVAKTLGGLTLWSAVCGATQSIQLKSPKFDEKPVQINKSLDNK